MHNQILNVFIACTVVLLILKLSPFLSRHVFSTNINRMCFKSLGNAQMVDDIL